MRIDRRQVLRGAGATAAGVALAANAAHAQSQPQRMRFANGSGVNDSQLAFTTCGSHPKLGFYEKEGIELKILNMSSASQTLQALATGEAEYASLSPMSYLPLMAKTPGLDLIAAYGWNRRNLTTVVVPAASPIQTIVDLKGRKIGIRNQGDTPYIALQTLFKELKLDPRADAEWIAVGNGGPAGEALAKNRIDALTVFDTDVARLELMGFKLRKLDLPQSIERLFTGCFGVSRKGLAADRKRYVGLFRGLAKSTVFMAANPEIAIRLHWDLYPETKPKGKSDAEAIREALAVLNARKDKLFAADWQPDKRMGTFDKDEWTAQLDFVAQSAPEVETLRGSLQAVYTDDLVADINAFDRAEIEKLARTVILGG